MKDDFYVESELEGMIQDFEDNNMSEQDALAEIMEYGYTAEDFKYNDKRYEWVRRVAKEYGLD